MEIKVLEKNDVAMRLLIQGVSVAFMNSIRRIMLSEVPCMAIDEVVIIENSSMLNDEILAHRLGLIPLKTDLDSYNLPEECPCKSEFGCNLCRVALTIDVEAGENTITVYSEALRSENPNISPVSNKVPIIKLTPNQKIRLEAYARLGKGKNHAKWQPVSACAYKYLPQIKINRKNCDTCGKCIEVCPKGVLVNAGKGIEIQRILECSLCQDCVDACPQSPSAIKVSGEENAFIFNVESTGALPVERIVIEALKILDKKYEDFLNQVR